MKKDKTKEKTSPPEVVTELKPWLPNVFVYVFFVFWSYLVLSNYYRQYPVGLHTLFWYFSLPGENFTLTTFFRLLPEYLFYVLLLVFFWLSTFALGWGFLKRIKVFEELNLENFLFSSGVGLAGLIVFGFFLGSLGLLYKGIVGIVVLVFAGLGFWELFKGKKDFTLKVNKLNLLEKICFILLGIVMLFHLIGAFAPETFYDAQYYHLGMTRMWVLEKRIFFTTYIGESGFPLNLHTFYTLAIVLKDETLVNLMHFSFGLMLVLLGLSFCRRYFSRETGLLSALIFVTTPNAGMMFWKAATELGLGFFECLAVYSFLNWCQENDPKNVQVANQPTSKLTNHQINYRWLILSALFAGLALGGKYTSFFCVFALAGTIVVKGFILERKKIVNLIKPLIILFLVVFLVFSPWIVRNVLNTNNPIYPFTLLGGRNLAVQHRGEKVLAADPPPYPLRVDTLFFLPWTLTMSKEIKIGTKNFGRTVQESFPGPLFLFFLPLLFFFKGSNKIIKIIFSYLGIYMFFWIFVGKAYLRYFVPALPVASVVVTYYCLEVKTSLWFRRIFLSLIILISIGNLFFLLQMQKFTRDVLPVFLGIQTKEEYLSTQRPTYPAPYYPTLDWANDNLPKEAKILFLGETRGAFSRGKFLTYGPGSFSPLIEFARQLNNGDELYRKLKEEKITHILFNVPEARRLAGYDIFYWEGKDLEIFLQFWNKYVKEIYKDVANISLPEHGIYSMKKQVPQWWMQYMHDPRNYVYLYEILSPEEAEKPHVPPLNFFLSQEFYTKERYEKIKNHFQVTPHQ